MINITTAIVENEPRAPAARAMGAAAATPTAGTTTIVKALSGTKIINIDQAVRAINLSRTIQR
jgi:hypothetical protein